MMITMKMNTEIKTILVPTDFSEKSNNAVAMATEMAMRHQSKILLFHVVNNYYLIDRSGKQVIGTKVVQENTEKAEDALETLKKSIQEKYSSLQVDIQLKSEHMVNSMNDLMISEDVDLVVMGTKGEQKLKQFILGSFSYSVLSNVHCSVLLIPEGFKKYEFKKILFPVRVLDYLNDKLELTLSLAKKNKSIINILGISDQNDVKNLTTAYLDVKKKLFIKSADYTSDFLLTEDKAVHISKFSKEENADLIVLNYEDEESWKSFFSENFLKKIINNTEIPLFFLKPKITRKHTDKDLGNYDITLPYPG